MREKFTLKLKCFEYDISLDCHANSEYRIYSQRRKGRLVFVKISKIPNNVLILSQKYKNIQTKIHEITCNHLSSHSEDEDNIFQYLDEAVPRLYEKTL